MVTDSTQTRWRGTRSGHWWLEGRSRGLQFMQSTRLKYNELFVCHRVAKERCELVILFIYFYWCNDNKVWQSIREHWQKNTTAMQQVVDDKIQ